MSDQEVREAQRAFEAEPSDRSVLALVRAAWREGRSVSLSQGGESLLAPPLPTTVVMTHVQFHGMHPTEVVVADSILLGNDPARTVVWRATMLVGVDLPCVGSVSLEKVPGEVLVRLRLNRAAGEAPGIPLGEDNE